VFIIYETTLELETCDLVHHVICRCRKHQQLASQEGGFVVCFPLNILMVHSSTLVVTTNGEHLTCGGFSLGETVCFGILEFIAVCFGSLSHSPEENDSVTVSVGMARSGSSLLHTILKDSIDKFYIASSGEGSSGFLVSWRHNMMTPPVPITTTPSPDDAPIPSTIATVPLQTIVL
jgi:hypothetical protein